MNAWLKPPGPVARGLRIGLLGGSFNPAHEGHVHVSRMALTRLGVDYVWWLVSPQNPLKSSRATAPLDERIAQAKRFVRDRRIVVSDAERVLGTRFTVDTLRALLRRFREAEFIWLMGSDNLASFHRWKNWPQIAELVPIAVVARPGSPLAPLQAKAMQRYAKTGRMRENRIGKPPAFVVVHGPRNPQSSTAIRAAGLVPPRVVI